MGEIGRIANRMIRAVDWPQEDSAGSPSHQNQIKHIPDMTEEKRRAELLAFDDDALSEAWREVSGDDGATPTPERGTTREEDVWVVGRVMTRSQLVDRIMDS